MPSVACDGGRGFWRNVRRCGCLSRGGHRETSERCGGGRVCLAAGPEERKRRASGRLSCGLVGKGEEPRHCGVCVHPRSAKLPNHCTRCNGSGEQTSLFAHERMLRGPPGHDPLSLDPLLVVFHSHCRAAAGTRKKRDITRSTEDRTHGTRWPTNARTVRRGVDTTTHQDAFHRGPPLSWPLRGSYGQAAAGLTRQRHCFQRATLQRRLSWSQPSATATAAAVNVDLGPPRAVDPHRPQAPRRVTRRGPPPAAGRFGQVDKQEARRLLVHSPRMRPCSYGCCFGYGCHAGGSVQ